MKAPTSWTNNPMASTADVIQYDLSTEPYDNAAQPYDGYASNTPSPNTPKNPTAYTPLSELYQQYYGGSVTYVPLYAAPSHWVFNPREVNQAGQYVESASAEANLEPFDSATNHYDATNTDFDSTNHGESFYSWKNPSAWTPITGGYM